MAGARFLGLFGLRDETQDELEYMATLSVMGPFVIYTIFLCIIPVSLVMISLTYARIDMKLHPDEHESRKERALHSDVDTSYQRLMQSYRGMTPRSKSRSRPRVERAAITGLGTTDLSQSSVTSLYPTTPILKWIASLGQREPVSEISTSDIINFIYWPLFTGGIFALAKPVVIFLFTTFLITLTVYPDEGKPPGAISTIPNTL